MTELDKILAELKPKPVRVFTAWSMFKGFLLVGLLFGTIFGGFSWMFGHGNPIHFGAKAGLIAGTFCVVCAIIVQVRDRKK
jgi:hypothetical protein